MNSTNSPRHEQHPAVISDLHRLQLSYQPLTPAPSDFQPHHSHRSHQYYSPRTCAYPPSFQHPYFKSEYGCMPINMADVPHVSHTDIAAKAEYSDDGNPGMVEMDQEEIDAIIRNKRKVRDPKACYACHRRKVKCDRNLPCDSCVKRDHPELCSYERPTKRRRIALSNALAQADGGNPADTDRVVNSGPNITVPKEQWERLNRELAQLRIQTKEEKEDGFSAATEEQPASGAVSQSDDGDKEGVHAPSTQMGTMHLGSRSVLAYMIGNRTKSSQDQALSLLEENILPNLGLDNETTTYPFVDLWATDSSMQDVTGLIKALPEDHLCREFWLTYRDIPCTIYPVVPDAEAFDQTLNFMLQNRAEYNRTGVGLDPNRPYGVTLSWVALFFAVLASGAQSTGRPAKERELTSQVYICCSYQALRMSNFLTHPNLETIEALLIIGNALSYNMNPGVSYVVIGMTLRNALSMGLHVPSQTFSEHENYLRARIWWALAWQDSHFSVSYDRPSSSILCTPEIPYTKQSTPGNRSYVESMSAIIRLTQAILRERTLNPKNCMSWALITKYKDDVHKIWEDALPRLRNRHQCVAMTDHLERLALRLHCSYVISEICRPALKEDRHPTPTSHPTGKSPAISPGSARRKSSLSGSSPGSNTADAQMTSHLRAECIKFLEQVVDTYVELRAINKFAARSWVGIQRSISAAFLLGLLPETRQEPRIIQLLTDLEKGIEQSAIEDSGFTREGDVNSPVNTEIRRLSITAGQSKDYPLWVKSMTKSLSALSKLNNALAGGQAGANMNQQYNGPPHPAAQGFQQMPPSAAAAMYNTPVVSPSGVNGVTSMPMNMQQYPMVYPPNSRGGMPMNMNSSQMVPGMGPYTPDSGAGDWNYANITERALEYVHPGLWG